MSTWCLILPAVIILDLLLGDPEKPFHPIRWMGNAIIFFEPIFRRLIKSEQIAGIFFAISLIAGTWGLTYSLLALVHAVSPALENIIETGLVFYTIAIHTLILSGLTVFRHLKKGQLEKARFAVSMIVGRDTRPLNKIGLTCATIETLAENFVDGIVSPLFYAIIGGAPLAMTFKMISTLDSMVGYKNEKYSLFGRCAARIDDIANYVPARLSVVFIAIAARILGFSALNSWKTAKNEGDKHLSPNAGYPEAAFSGALGIRLNGPNIYHGKMINKPFIGKHFPIPHINHIVQACTLVLFSTLITFGFFWGILSFCNALNLLT
ncbi:cobalamin biosynthesis protein CobD [Candidatus Magnetomorum sp. HK-1]|nr:cobalamin biosynthesis protein CobD [Candidatus Magnetomorum sp. HK-1]